MPAFILTVLRLAGNALWSLLASLLTEALFKKIVSKLLIVTLRKMAKYTDNMVDDEIVEDVVAALNTKPPVDPQA